MLGKKQKTLTKEIYLKFSDSKDYSFKDQIQRASCSIMNNIAEGFEGNRITNSNIFCLLQKGSCGEVRSMLILSYELNKINESEYKYLSSLSEEISKMISGLIKTL